MRMISPILAALFLIAGVSAHGEQKIPQGKAVFDQWCAGCHAPMPPPAPGGAGGFAPFPPAGTYLLQKRYGDSVPAALEQRTDLTPELIRTIVRQGLAIMPPTRKSEVDDRELEALIAYLTGKTGKP